MPARSGTTAGAMDLVLGGSSGGADTVVSGGCGDGIRVGIKQA